MVYLDLNIIHMCTYNLPSLPIDTCVPFEQPALIDPEAKDAFNTGTVSAAFKRQIRSKLAQC